MANIKSIGFLLAVLVFSIGAEVEVSASRAFAPSPYEGIKGAYWPSWLAEALSPPSIPTSLFTHLYYAFIQPDATTYQLSVTQADGLWMRNFTTTFRGRTPRPKIFLTVGGGATSPSMFSTMASNPSHRGAFIQSTIAVVSDPSHLGQVFARWSKVV